MRKLERVQQLLRNRVGEKPGLELVLEEALDEYLKRYCPRERRQRRIKRAQGKKNAQSRGPVAQERLNQLARMAQEAVAELDAQERRSRYVPVALRDEVLERDGHQCTYLSPAGVRCTACCGLEIDHRVPFGMGGQTCLDNLRTFCKTHNLFEAEQAYGREYLERFRRKGVVMGEEVEALHPPPPQ